MLQRQIISQQDFTSIQEAQAGLNNLFTKATKNKTFYTLMKNNSPLGVMIPKNVWEELLEDIEALSSNTYKKKIKASRASTQHYSLDDIKRECNI